MTKFQKIQKALGIIPFYSTIFIAIVTYIVLFKNKATMKYWLKYGIICSASIGIVYVINRYVMTGAHLFLNILVSGLILFLTNIFLVEMQIKIKESVIQSTPKSELINNTKKESNPLCCFIKKYKYQVIVCSIIVLIFLIVVIVSLRMISLYESRVIKDINGSEDYSLAVITQDQINDTHINDYHAVMVSSSYDGENSEVSDRKYKNSDYEQVNMSCKSFSGIKIFNATKTKSNSVTFEISSKVLSGNFAIMVFVDGVFYSDVTINSIEKITVNDSSDKTILIKIIGEDANIQVNVQRNFEK